jgi:hypothetical protein
MLQLVYYFVRHNVLSRDVRRLNIHRFAIGNREFSTKYLTSCKINLTVQSTCSSSNVTVTISRCSENNHLKVTLYFQTAFLSPCIVVAKASFGNRTATKSGVFGNKGGKHISRNDLH